MHLTRIGLVDLTTVLLVVLAVVGALRRRTGATGIVAALVSTLVLAWLVSVAVVAWGPEPATQAVRRSALVQLVPVPERALAELHRLGGPDRPTPPH